MLYEQEDYGGVVQACSAKISPDIAKLCVLAACQQHDAAKAAQWQQLVRPSSEHNQLPSACRKLSGGIVELDTGLDCAHNPLDCR